jgi:uncharacterized repeat protein (TIGR03803 family)
MRTGRFNRSFLSQSLVSRLHEDSAKLFVSLVLTLIVSMAIAVPSARATTYSESVLYSFCSQGGTNCTDGSLPFARLIQAHDGNFYGTTGAGGANAFINRVSNGDGVVFRLSPSGQETVLHNFCSQNGSSCTDGAVPTVLTEGPDGNFYSTTELGGAHGKGTIFKITPGGTLTTLYNFCSTGGSSCTDGAISDAGMTLGSDGNFYGTTNSGGSNGGGTIYKITTSGVFSTLYNFCSQGGTSCTDWDDSYGPSGPGQRRVFLRHHWRWRRACWRDHFQDVANFCSHHPVQLLQSGR